MKYSSLIDNVTSLKWGLNIQLAYLFDWVYGLPSWADSVIIENHTYYFASKTKAIEELALLTDKLDTMYRYYKQLEDLGLIVVKKIDGKDYISLTNKAKCWNTKSGKKSERSERHPKKSGFKSEKAPDLNPTYKTTISDKITSNNPEDSCESSVTVAEEILGENKGLFDGIQVVEENKVKAGGKKKEPTKKKEKEVDPAFKECVRIWLKEIHPDWVGFNASEGKALKELLKKMRAFSLKKNEVEISTEDLCNFFKHYCKSLPEFYKAHELKVISSKFDSIIEQIKTGRDKNTDFRNKPSSIFSQYQ